jgi:hypothetical protein
MSTDEIGLAFTAALERLATLVRDRCAAVAYASSLPDHHEGIDEAYDYVVALENELAVAAKDYLAAHGRLDRLTDAKCGWAPGTGTKQ